MGMDPGTGFIRALKNADELKENEVLFTVGEKLGLKDCQFEVTEVYPDPINEITLRGIEKEKDAGGAATQEPPPATPA